MTQEPECKASEISRPEVKRLFEMLSSAGTEAAVMEIGNTVTEVSEKFLIALLVESQ